MNKPYCNLIDGPMGRGSYDDNDWSWYDMSCFNPDCITPGYDCGY